MQISVTGRGAGLSLFRFEGVAIRSYPGDAGLCAGPSGPMTRARRPLALHAPHHRVVVGGASRAVQPFENSKASTSIFVLQATKSQR